MEEQKFLAWERNLKEIIPVYNINFATKMINTGIAWRTFDEIDFLEYTGVKDSNGTAIYEGHIVQFIYGERPEVSSFDGGHDVVDGWTEDEFLEVKFVRGSFMIGKHLLWALEGWPFDYSLKVVGNVYQNRELLNQN